MPNSSNKTNLNSVSQIKEILSTLQVPSVSLMKLLGIHTEQPRQDEYAELLQKKSTLEKLQIEVFTELRVIAGAPIEPRSMRSLDTFEHLRIETHLFEENISNSKGDSNE